MRKIPRAVMVQMYRYSPVSVPRVSWISLVPTLMPFHAAS
jgi:hypothetical protein